MRKLFLVLLTLLILLPLTMQGSTAYFLDSETIPVAISADSTSSDWLIDYTLNGHLGQVAKGKTVQINIGSITTKVDNLVVDYEVRPSPDYNPSLGIYNIWDLRDTELITPASPFTISTIGDGVALTINIKVLGNHPMGTYKGEMVLSFRNPSIEPFIILLEIEVIKK